MFAELLLWKFVYAFFIGGIVAILIWGAGPWAWNVPIKTFFIPIFLLFMVFTYPPYPKMTVLTTEVRTGLWENDEGSFEKVAPPLSPYGRYSYSYYLSETYNMKEGWMLNRFVSWEYNVPDVYDQRVARTDRVIWRDGGNFLLDLCKPYYCLDFKEKTEIVHLNSDFWMMRDKNYERLTFPVKNLDSNLPPLLIKVEFTFG